MRRLIFVIFLIVLVSCSSEDVEQPFDPSEVLKDGYETLMEGEAHRILDQTLEEEVCRGKSGECSRTKRIISHSSDGFIFEYFQSDSRDNVSCDENTICSSIGDYGGGRSEMNIWSYGMGVLTEDGPKLSDLDPLRIMGVDSAIQLSLGVQLPVLSRKWAPIGYPYLVIKHFSGGASCCVRFDFYLKENLHLEPYIVGYSRNDILYFVLDDQGTFNTIHPGSANNEMIGSENLTPLIANHFADQIK